MFSGHLLCPQLDNININKNRSIAEQSPYNTKPEARVSGPSPTMLQRVPGSQCPLRGLAPCPQRGLPAAPLPAAPGVAAQRGE